MPARAILCEEPTINCFCKNVKKEGIGNITSLDNFKKSSSCKGVILGKIVRTISVGAEEKKSCFLMREVLPNGEYGEKFKAVIVNKLSVDVCNATLEIGDRLAFANPNIHCNPAFKESTNKKMPRFVIDIGSSKHSLLLYSKKQLVSSTTTTPQKKVSPHKKNVSFSAVSSISPQNEDENISPVASYNRPKPHIQLPTNPQIPVNTKKLNPQYTYKTVSQIKTDALSGDLGQVNTFAVVSQITKPLSCTTSGKYTIICKIVDNSLTANEVPFDMHFFTPEPKIIGQIEEGDVLRLHRVKLETYNDRADGRVFSSNDIILFKKNTSSMIPITTAKKYLLTEEEKNKVAILKTWYKDEFCETSCLKHNTSILSTISKEGFHNIICKIVSEPVIEDSSITLTVTDGSIMLDEGLAPSSVCNAYHTPLGHVTTDIKVFKLLEEYSQLKVGDFLYIHKVRATKIPSKPGLHLTLHNHTIPKVLSKQMEDVLEIERRLKSLEVFTKENNQNKGANENAQRLMEISNKGSKKVNQNSLRDSKNNQPENGQNTKDIDSSIQIINIQPVNTKERDRICKYISNKLEQSTIKNSKKSAEKERKLKGEKAKFNLSSCVVNCCKKPAINGHEPHVCIGNKEESSVDVENQAGKKKKVLYTANYADLSVGSDDISEKQESVRRSSSESVSPPVVMSVSPRVNSSIQMPASPRVNSSKVDTSIEEFVELITSKYCSPRKLASYVPTENEQPKVPDSVTSPQKNALSDKLPTARSVTNSDSNCCCQLAVVKLIKLTEEECKNKRLHEKHNCRKGKSLNKRTSSTADDLNNSQVDLGDADTVVNLSLQDTRQQIKRARCNVHAPALSAKSSKLLEEEMRKLRPEPVPQKVINWLSSSVPEESELEESDLHYIQRVLQGHEVEDVDMTSYLNAYNRRTEVFLLQVIPDPKKKSEDLISGYCQHGCRQLYLFSTLIWEEHGENEENKPWCPGCRRLNMNKPVQLMFMVQLHVMDKHGRHDTVFICREHGEHFFGCSVKDFVSDPELRKSRVQLLLDYSLENFCRRPYEFSSRQEFTPLLDLSIANVVNILTVVNSRLKLPDVL